MAASNAVAGLTTLVRFFQYGGQSSKKAKRKVITFVDATNGVTVGGTTHKILATDMGFSFIESCSNLCVYTTATGAVVSVVPAVPSPDGTFIALADLTQGTDANRAQAADIVITTAQSAYIVVDGY